MKSCISRNSLLSRLRRQGYEVRRSVCEEGRQTARLYNPQGEPIVILDLGRTPVGEHFVDSMINDALMSRAVVAEVAGMIDLTYPSGVNADGGLATHLIV